MGNHVSQGQEESEGEEARDVVGFPSRRSEGAEAIRVAGVVKDEGDLKGAATLLSPRA
jgi:hypothetical protein